MVELAAASLRASGRLRMRVLGSSMLPSIRPGDIVTVRRASHEEARLGEVVLFQRFDRFFAHRVVGCREGLPVTRGDAVAVDDPPVEPHEFLGILECRPRTLLDRMGSMLFRHSALAGRLYTRLNARAPRAAA